MKSTTVDRDGNVRCPACGAKQSFTSKRTGKAKLFGVATVGVGAVVMPKRLKCNGCGENLKRGGGSFEESTAGRRAALAAGAAPQSFRERYEATLAENKAERRDERHARLVAQQDPRLEKLAARGNAGAQRLLDRRAAEARDADES